ncbi:MAG: hypothetical protein KF832_06400 [Caldilineaceae bacterium]|nr:hypothetical protein [Caldilineaceae bacterium]
MRTWGNYAFAWAAQIRPDTDDSGAVAAIQPHVAYANPQQLTLHSYGEGPFCKFRISTTLQEAGVYLLLVNDAPIYVGECTNLATRFNHGYGAVSPRDCYTGGRPAYCRINNLIYNSLAAGQRVEVWFRKTTNRQAIAAELIKLLNTTWNQ